MSTSEVRTRSGRVSKPPVRYEPQEQVEDDYGPDDYDTDESSIDSYVSSDGEYDDEDDEDEDVDDDGNLADFVVPDKNEESDSESDGPKPPIPSRRARTAVKKRPVPASRKDSV